MTASRTSPPSQIGACLPHIAELTAVAASREKFIRGVLTALLDVGFERARFYEMAMDVVREEPLVVLTAELPEAGSSRRGLEVDFAFSSIAQAGGGLDPVIGAGDEDDTGPDWLRKLELGDRSWIELPVTERGAPVGVLACDWHGSPDDLTDSDREALRALGALVGSHLGLKPITALEHYHNIRSVDPDASTEELAIEAAKHLGTVLDAAITSIFAFRWPSGTLKKIDEHYAPAIRKRASEVGYRDETYRLGEAVTGAAWTHKQLHHVVTFESLRTLEEHRASVESLRWHADVLGSVRSVMFAIIGELDQRYLIRMVNRAQAPELPFLSEFTVLDTILGELRSDFDAAVATKRLKSLQEMTRIVDGVQPDALVDKIAQSLRAENVDNFMVLCHQRDSAQLGYCATRGPRVGAVPLDPFREWRTDSLYARAIIGQMAVLRLSDFPDADAREVAHVLRRQQFGAALTIPIHTGQTAGAFIVPLDVVPPKLKSRSSFEAPTGCGFGTISLLLSYARLLGNAVATVHSQAKSDGARRALGLMGHELRGPLAALGSSAEKSINAALRAIDATAGRTIVDARALRSAVLEEQSKLYDRQKEVSVALELAPIAAQESEGKLQLHFQRTNVVRLLESAVEHVEHEVRADGGSPKRYEFVFAQSSRRLGELVCDPEYMRHVLKNVLRNAVKYSLPRTPGEPMIIDLIGEPQTGWVGIKVRNWGLGIPEEKRDLIFEPWVRGDIADRMKAIRGMGLGLFLTRRILAAHAGEILYTSRFTLDDPERAKVHEGYETVFEIRVPPNLKPGTHTHRWGETAHTSEVKS